MEIVKIKLANIIFLFLGYIVVHTIIGLYLGNIKKELEEKPGNIDLEKMVNIFEKIFKYFPFGYVIFVIFVLWV